MQLQVCFRTGPDFENTFSRETQETARRRAQKNASSRKSCFDKKSGRHQNTGKYRVFHIGRNFEKHVFHENPGKRPDDERKNRGQVENRVLNKKTGDTKTQAKTLFFRLGQNFGKHVFHINPGKTARRRAPKQSQSQKSWFEQKSGRDKTQAKSMFFSGWPEF